LKNSRNALVALLTLGTLAASPCLAVAAVSVVRAFTFEKGTSEWHPVGPVKLRADSDNSYQPNSLSLRAEGESPAKEFSFAYSSDFKVDPGKNYQFGGAMNVESTSDPENHFAIYVIVDSVQGTSRKNVVSSTFGVDKGPTKKWARVGGSFTAPNEGNLVGHFVIVKSKPTAIKAVVRLADLKLELAQ